MEVQLSEKAIGGYIDGNKNKTVNPLSYEISKISYAASRGVEAVDRERREVKKAIDAAVTVINSYLDICNQKIDSIRFYLEKTPAAITVTETETVEKTNEDGSKGTDIKEVKREIPNPAHNELQAMLARAENYKRQLEDYRRACLKHNEKVKALELAQNQFEAAAHKAEEFAKEIAANMCNHLNALSAQAEGARKQLKGAKAGYDPFPAIYDNRGWVELNGLRRYIVGLQEKINRCAADAERLVRVAGDMGYGWSDDVYEKFYNDTLEIRGGVAGVIKELEIMNNALDFMYGRLYDYVQIYPNVVYTPRNFSYSPVTLPWSKSSSSTSATLST